VGFCRLFILRKLERGDVDSRSRSLRTGTGGVPGSSRCRLLLVWHGSSSFPSFFSSSNSTCIVFETGDEKWKVWEKMSGGRTRVGNHCTCYGSLDDRHGFARDNAITFRRERSAASTVYRETARAYPYCMSSCEQVNLNEKKRYRNISKYLAPWEPEAARKRSHSPARHD
jgi:hypothetical protein